MNEVQKRKNKFSRLVIGYPVALIAIAIVVNLLVFGVDPIVVALPARSTMIVLAICASLLLVNHTWLMTSTELTRVRFSLAATPEELERLAADADADPGLAQEELERRHNAHRNATENTVYFGFLALILAFTSPGNIAGPVWPLCYAIARLGYTKSYLIRETSARGIFMSLALLSLYGMASYMLIAATL